MSAYEYEKIKLIYQLPTCKDMKMLILKFYIEDMIKEKRKILSYKDNKFFEREKDLLDYLLMEVMHGRLSLKNYIDAKNHAFRRSL